MSLPCSDAALVQQMIQRIPGFPRTRKVRERRITYGLQGWVQRLDWSRLGLDQVPAEVEKLVHVEDLDLRSNRLTGVPAELLGKLAQLRELDLGDNRLTEVPPELGQLSQVRWLDLSGNPDLQSPPLAMVAQGAKAILAYLRDLQDFKQADD